MLLSRVVYGEMLRIPIGLLESLDIRKKLLWGLIPILAGVLICWSLWGEISYVACSASFCCFGLGHPG